MLPLLNFFQAHGDQLTVRMDVDAWAGGGSLAARTLPAGRADSRAPAHSTYLP